MTLEEAINTAIEYERRVCDVYAEALEKTTSEVGKRVFGVLADEEQRHVDYLHYKLDEWKNTGKVTTDKLTTDIPAGEVIEKAVGVLDNKMAADDRGAELQMLEKALQVEVETSNFYKRMVQEIGPEGQMLFARFVEIEEGHQAIVRAEIDSLSGSGFWFDMPEFNLEAE